MVMTLVVLTFVFFIALDYFVLSKRREERTATTVAGALVEPLSALHLHVPAGVFLQPTYTWSRTGASGEVYLGVHPMLLGLVGAPYEMEFRARGEHLEKGEPLVRIGRGGKHLTVRSPLAGRVEQVNRHVADETQWRGADAMLDGGWLYRVQPERTSEEEPTWLAGDRAAEWTRRQYERVRGYLHDAVAAGHLGAVMADGGELPAGILSELDQGVWTGLEDRFLSHAG